ncbi:hypothetical protein KUF54_12170 [Comamonas sp. Y33R10-2]|uniref:hypothetical protein n=1 Tax=Comamonas sp. Y33R10-2 TaxID=2853257 RepID=UPI001C5CBE6D|nr:hypothetical protein [Comamonas sp. Y33R10-2]QXZ08812.1 hypothetical protein KUF54_12170 [Comamonas sp. Y33R10-2]
MKTKKIPVGQLLCDGLGDSDNAIENIENLMPLIGDIVVWFNALENDLNHALCDFISDRSVQKGILVVSNMMYSTKLELFEKFASDWMGVFQNEPVWFQDLIADLKTCSSLRNKVVHANWLETDDAGYTQVRIRVARSGLAEHELTLFTAESLTLILKKIIATRNRLGELISEHLIC